MALIGDNQVRMANICAYTANSINGVSKLHSEIIKDSVFHDYYLFKPQAFKNVTNGIAYRRWLLASNPELCKLLDETIGDGVQARRFQPVQAEQVCGRQDRTEAHQRDQAEQ